MRANVGSRDFLFIYLFDPLAPSPINMTPAQTHTHMHSCFANRALLTQRAHFFCVPKMIKIPFRNSTGNHKASTRTFTQNKCLRLTSTYRSRELTDSNNDWMCAVWFGKRHMYATTQSNITQFTVNLFLFVIRIRVCLPFFPPAPEFIYFISFFLLFFYLRFCFCF